MEDPDEGRHALRRDGSDRRWLGGRAPRCSRSRSPWIRRRPQPAGRCVGGRWGLHLRVSGLGFDRRIAVGNDRAAGVETGSATGACSGIRCARSGRSSRRRASSFDVDDTSGPVRAEPRPAIGGRPRPARGAAAAARAQGAATTPSELTAARSCSWPGLRLRPSVPGLDQVGPEVRRQERLRVHGTDPLEDLGWAPAEDPARPIRARSGRIDP